MLVGFVGESGESGSDEFAMEFSETSRCVFVVFADERLCTWNAFATARADIKLCANLRQRRCAGIHRSADGSVGNVMADANNHGGLVMCKCEQFLFRLLTKPDPIARVFCEILPGGSNRRNLQRGWGDRTGALRREGGPRPLAAACR